MWHDSSQDQGYDMMFMPRFALASNQDLSRSFQLISGTVVHLAHARPSFLDEVIRNDASTQPVGTRPDSLAPPSLLGLITRCSAVVDI